ncbi:hypothetical protein SFC65_19760 [Priestia filamentosa]|uniref:hypothetical protein n=1 Tax=Priestia filamentosa TaxID=1402861 RepID=UPI0039821FAD
MSNSSIDFEVRANRAYKEGYQEGYQEGCQIGRTKERAEIIKALIGKLPDEIIIETMGVTAEHLKEFKKHIAQLNV